MQNICI